MNDKSKLRKLNLKETQEELLDLLLKFDSFCKEHKINYFLSGGTLLGAIRHQGFIPWDDDIDLMIPRMEYEKLKRILNKTNTPVINPKHYTNDDKYFFPYLRIVEPSVFVKMPFYNRYNPKKVSENLNLFIDIFPIDGVPKLKLLQKFLFLRIKYLRKFAKSSLIRVDWFGDDETFVRKIGKFIFVPVILLCRIFGHKFFLDKIENLIKRADFEKAEFVAACTGINGTKEIMSKKAVENYIDVQFEKYSFKAPQGYDEYLSNLYGNYMELPPEDKRISHFDGLVFKVE